MKTFNKFWLFTVVALLAVVLAACGSEDNKGAAEPQDSVNEVRIGYFPNMTHIATIVALEKGFYSEQLGNDVKITTNTFNDGSAFMEAMSTDAIDVGTVGPTPALTSYMKSPKHEIISGAVNGGAVLVVRKDAGIDSVKDLAGKTVAIPTFGSTQDIALMKALQDAGLKVKTNGGDVNTVKQAPADTAALFVQKQVDAAATQEPWGVNIENKADAKLLLGPDDFAWGKESTNTVVVAQTDFTKANPETTTKLLKAHAEAVDFINKNPEQAIDLFLKHIKDITGKELSKEEVTESFKRLTPTTAVNEEVLQEMATISKEAGYISKDDINGLVNLSYLKEATK
ncbi:aliphatic sulfonate ABC transporter substrate-binding protein [Kurthia huakuii]|uniref:aliphatic sulfonate ABC transporter substrate-binding protein n=1 Tax=Kurthia huakuii TaxID=1421019 RepID=UPI0004965CCE|nr:aliphatic sulfonate ABC transporter substrate-binding protein [Kurthia huakuii]MBM7699505.1 NitT/TauT family transport system substrate-binding protein [Kurthia huakuii]